jgi:hypothetical protein
MVHKHSIELMVPKHSIELTVHKHSTELPDIFYFQGQIFIFRSFLFLSIGKVMG